MSYLFPHEWERESFREYRTDRPEVCGLKQQGGHTCKEEMTTKVLLDGTVMARCPRCDGGSW